MPKDLPDTHSTPTTTEPLGLGLSEGLGRPVPKREVFAWECNVRGKDWQRTINHLTAGKARYEYLLDLRDAWPDATFADITVRKIGPAHTSEAFRRTAAIAGCPR